MFKPEDFKKGDRVILLMRPRKMQDSNRTFNFGNLLLRGEIEHVWQNGEPQGDYSQRYVFNIRAHTSDNVLTTQPVTTEKPTFITLIKADINSSDVFLMKDNEEKFKKLWHALAYISSMTVHLEHKEKELKELLAS
jgi:hypothetical protein